MRLISWNVRGQVQRLIEQADAIASRTPDIVALQEVTVRTTPMLREELGRRGLTSVRDSFQLSTSHDLLRGPRRYGELIASRWPVQALEQAQMLATWPERLLSVLVSTPHGFVEVHTAHIPPGASNGWIKIEVLEGIYRSLAVPTERPRILCGDFNTPQAETTDGEVITWAYRKRREAWAMKASRGERWNAGERNVLVGLRDFDLHDVYRRLRGYDATEFSWHLRRKGTIVRRRFDHIFASWTLNPIRCQYIHEFREEGLSDHSLIEADFGPAGSRPTHSARVPDG